MATLTGGIVLDAIPFTLKADTVLERLKMRRPEPRIKDMVQELIDAVTTLAKPKVVYRISRIDSSDGKKVVVDGMEFSHHVATLSFGEGERVFPYVATCGTEAETLKTAPGDMMKGYCLNIIKGMALHSADTFFRNYLKQTYNLVEVSRIGPGEAMGTVAQHRNLFSVIGDVTGAIGVRLSEHNLMLPEKSTSGIYFETAVSMESCQLCPNECKTRRAPYDPEIYEKFRAGKEKR